MSKKIDAQKVLDKMPRGGHDVAAWLDVIVNLRVRPDLMNRDASRGHSLLRWLSDDEREAVIDFVEIK